eukprot:TRINITY_DN76087_c0_g1_i1.p1 TRINITY_DN76087_c0_g1~~TRINITY_DN76087_c0_g1_i1.p1  ORF type:complete len:1146 (+),score=320.18 TRINITY_DN76087_c0_g1_i1:117-3554(+)
MDGIHFDDMKAAGGMRILTGKRAKASPSMNTAGKADQEEKDESSTTKSLTGLDLGRRLLVVMKSNPPPQSDGTAPLGRGSQQAVRVVDHGIQQREAVRRLFDAQVLLQSYEEQLQAKDVQLEKIQLSIKQVIRETGGQALRDPALFDALGLSNEQLLEEGIVAEEYKGGAGRVGKFDAEKDQAFETQKWEEQQDRERKAKEAGDLPGGSRVADAGNDDLSWYKIPYWLREDEVTRNIVTQLKSHMVDDFNTKSRLDPNTLLDHFWQCGLQVAQRWAGNPSEEVQKHAEYLEGKCKETQRQALKETSMLRQHIKRMERKYKEMQSNTSKMQKAMSRMAAELKEARDTAAMFGVEPSDARPGPMVAASFGSTAGGGFGSTGNQGRGASSKNAPAGPEVGLSESVGDFAAALARSQGQRVDPLFGDDTLDMVADQDQLDEMDNELFEPLSQFDPDVQDLMVDVITEKVRRILSLDPSKYKNGRLPFGLKPHKGAGMADEGIDFEEELEKLRELYDRLKEENELLLKQLEAARAAAERWKHKFNELRDNPPAAGEAAAEAAGRALGRGKAPPKEEVEEEEPTQAAFIPPKKEKAGPKGFTQAEVDAMLAEAAKEFQKKIASLEKKVAQLEAEIEALKKKKPKTKAEEEEEEEQKRRARQKAAQEEPKEKKKKEKEEVEEKVEKAPESQDAQLRAMIEDWKAANKQSVETALRALKKLASITDHQLPAAELKFMEKLLKSESPVAGEVQQAMKAGAPKLDLWVGEALEKFRATFTPVESGAPAPVVERKATPKVQTVVEKETLYQGDPQEVLNLKQQMTKQQQEISKLLITIDELRKRLENIKAVSLEAGPGVAGTVNNIMEQVGLKDIMEAKAAAPPVLKGVFERLYQDAVQRIQRYGLIREQMLLANKTYAAVVDAIKGPEQLVGDDEMPDFERLSATTDATVRGMWYHTEYLFRRACEYAMSQGVEASLLKAQRGSFNEMLETEGDAGYEDQMYHKAQRARDRLPGRRSDRPSARQGARDGDTGKLSSNWTSAGTTPSAGVPYPTSPHKFRKMPPEGETPFTSYVAALREARGDVSKDAWARVDKMERKLGKSESASDGFKTLKAACGGANPTGSPPMGGGMSVSHSLPALPKGRTIFQTQTPDADA